MFNETIFYFRAVNKKNLKGPKSREKMGFWFRQPPMVRTKKRSSASRETPTISKKLGIQKIPNRAEHDAISSSVWFQIGYFTFCSFWHCYPLYRFDFSLSVAFILPFFTKCIVIQLDGSPYIMCYLSIHRTQKHQEIAKNKQKHSEKKRNHCDGVLKRSLNHPKANLLYKNTIQNTIKLVRNTVQSDKKRARIKRNRSDSFFFVSLLPGLLFGSM